MMKNTSLSPKNQREVARLFNEVFSDSEGSDEGKLLGSLTEKLSLIIDNKSTFCFGTYSNDALVASIFFTQLFNDEEILIYMLAPVAVSSAHQGKGVGQSLIKFGIEKIKRASAKAVVTYGDPKFYSKIGFSSLSESSIPAPLEMSIPHGWLGLSLTAQPIPKLKSKTTCVGPFDDSRYW